MLKFLRSPYLDLLSGFILMITAGYETWERLGEYSIGVHHGVLIFSIIQIAKSIPEIRDGLKDIDEAEESLHKKPRGKVNHAPIL